MSGATETDASGVTSRIDPDDLSAARRAGSGAGPAEDATVVEGSTAPGDASTASSPFTAGGTQPGPSAPGGAPTGPWTPAAGQPYAGGQAYAGQPYPGGQPYAGQAYTGQPYAAGQPGYPSGPYGPAGTGPYPPPTGPYPPTGYGPPGYPAYGIPPAEPTSGLAIGALICGILGFFTAGLTSIPAVICGHLAWPRTRSGQESGHGLTVAGLVLGYIPIVGWVVFWVFFAFVAGSSHSY